MRSRSALTALSCGLAVLAGCGAPAGEPPGGGQTVRPTPEASLTMVFRAGRDTRRATLVCGADRDRVTGYLRLEQASDLCRLLGELGPFLTSAPPRGRACTQVYGGPETAIIEGEIDGRPVARRLARTDGCRLADWERVQRLLPDPDSGGPASGAF